MKLGGFDSSGVVANMSQFQLEQSSVIKTAPPGRNLEFTPKHEPIDLAPLTQSNLQDLSKMQPSIDYYQPAAYRVYQDAYLTGINSNAQNALLSQSSVNGIYYPTVFQQSAVTQQDWSRPMEYQQQYQRGTTLQYAQEQPQERVYKNVVDMPSPVDSGIGADLSLLQNAKEEFFQSTETLGLERPERALSHRDSPIVIPKLQNILGFQYVLEAPISTSIRKEDDRMTYVNKGQFYTVNLDYIPDPCKGLKNQIVKSQLMVVFREDKTYEEEIKTWQFWHSRQHSAKQRILEVQNVDSKNSSGMIGQITEIAHNAVEFYWNPSEQSGGVKISIAVQCLSTDFSNQKGVKGLPLHVQIDTYDGEHEKIPFHRGYAQIKVFCDKGANRKMLHETRRDEKRRIQGTVQANGFWPNNQASTQGAIPGRKKSDGEYHEQCDRSEFYHMRELDKPAALFIAPEEYDRGFLDTTTLGYDLDIDTTPRRPRQSERMMLYVRKQNEQIYTPLHIVPSTLVGLANGVAPKFMVDADKVTGIYKRCAKGITVKMDDDMLRHYCNEDTFVVDMKPSSEDPNGYSVFLIEQLPSSYQQQA